MAGTSVPSIGTPLENGKVAVPINCNKMFAPADVAGIFPTTVTVSAYTERDNACVLKSADGSVAQVSADDNMESALWTDPELNQRDKLYKHMSGLGDEAFFKPSDDGAQVFIRKGDRYCGVVAGINHPKVTGEMLTRKLGELCNKFFAAR